MKEKKRTRNHSLTHSISHHQTSRCDSETSILLFPFRRFVEWFQENTSNKNKLVLRSHTHYRMAGDYIYVVASHILGMEHKNAAYNDKLTVTLWRIHITQAMNAILVRRTAHSYIHRSHAYTESGLHSLSLFLAWVVCTVVHWCIIDIGKYRF